MLFSHRSRRSHEESQQTKRAGDRVGTVPAVFRLDVTAGEKYLILDQVSSDQVHVLDAQQREIDVIPDEDDTSRMVLAPQTSGTYYLSIQEEWGETEYDVIVRQPQDDYGNRPATAVPLIEGQVINGEIEDYPDKDLFRFNAIAGELYIFEGVPDELWLRILNGRGREVVNCPDGCEPMPYTGTYYIQVDSDDWGVGTYALSVRHVVDDNPGDMAAARPLNIGTPIAGTIDYGGDSDWFVFRAVAGRTYEFAVDENYFGIYDAHGREMDLVGDWTDDEKYLDRQEFVAPSSGLYYLQVTDDIGVDYSITSSAEETTDPTVPGVASPITFDANVQGSIDTPAHSDYFSFHAEKYGSYVMQRGDDDGMLIALIAPDGKTILDPDYGGLWTADEAGTYYLWARAFDPAGTA